MFQSLSVIINALPTLILGAGITLQLTAISILLGMVGGALIGIARLSSVRPLRWVTRAYIDFFGVHRYWYKFS